MLVQYLKIIGITCLTISMSSACKQEHADSPSTELVDPTPAPPNSQFQEAIKIKPHFDSQAQAVVVDLELEPGYHVYTTGETTGRPIRLQLANGGDWKPAGDPVYPEGTKKSTALGNSVVLEGKVTSKLAVEPAVNEPGSLQGHFHYQVCTNRACDRPRTLDFTAEPIINGAE